MKKIICLLLSLSSSYVFADQVKSVYEYRPIVVTKTQNSDLTGVYLEIVMLARLVDKCKKQEGAFLGSLPMLVNRDSEGRFVQNNNGHYNMDCTQQNEIYACAAVCKVKTSETVSPDTAQ